MLGCSLQGIFIYRCIKNSVSLMEWMLKMMMSTKLNAFNTLVCSISEALEEISADICRKKNPSIASSKERQRRMRYPASKKEVTIIC